jgi:hypothetical protein
MVRPFILRVKAQPYLDRRRTRVQVSENVERNETVSVAATLPRGDINPLTSNLHNCFNDIGSSQGTASVTNRTLHPPCCDGVLLRGHHVLESIADAAYSEGSG